MLVHRDMHPALTSVWTKPLPTGCVLEQRKPTLVYLKQDALEPITLLRIPPMSGCSETLACVFVVQFGFNNGQTMVDGLYAGNTYQVHTPPHS